MADDGSIGMSEKFVNRRGHHHDIEPEDSLVFSVELPKNIPTTRSERVRRTLPWKKIIAMFALVLLIGFGAFELITISYSSSVDGAKSALLRLQDSDLQTLQKQESVSSQDINKMKDLITDIRDKLCPGEFVDNLAALYPRAKTTHDTCISYRAKFDTLISALEEMKAKAAYLEQLSPLIKPMTVASNDKFAIISVQRDNWKSLEATMNSLSVPGMLSEEHSALKNAVSDLATTWNDSTDAFNTQNAAVFTEKSILLPAKYDTFRSTADALEASLNKSQQKVTSAYIALKN